jgi:hypothetical protein
MHMHHVCMYQMYFCCGMPDDLLSMADREIGIASQSQQRLKTNLTLCPPRGSLESVPEHGVQNIREVGKYPRDKMTLNRSTFKPG